MPSRQAAVILGTVRVRSDETHSATYRVYVRAIVADGYKNQKQNEQLQQKQEPVWLWYLY